MDLDNYIVAHAIISYIYNTSGIRFAQEIFGKNSHPSYLAEKAETWAKSPARAIGLLDRGNFQKLVNLAISKYGLSARQFLVD